jgi:hypothetical protein
MRKALMLLGALALAGLATPVLADDYPNGCVSCHVNEGGVDMRLDTLLARIGHGRGGERTKEIPVGCNRCHASDGSGVGPATRKLVHTLHYREPSENLFVTQYGGNCLHCHSMDGATGKAAIKVGERNWSLSVGGSD